MPVPPPLSERSVSNTSAYSSGGLARQSFGGSAGPSPTESVFPSDFDLHDRLEESCSLEEGQRRLDSGHAVEDSKTTSACSRRSSYSSHAKYQNIKVYEDYSAPIWVPDNRTANCMRCGGIFALWRRRHHCRLCGDVVCWACSTKKTKALSCANLTTDVLIHIAELRNPLSRWQRLAHHWQSLR